MNWSSILVAILTPVITAATAMVAHALTRLISQRIKSDAFRAALIRINDVVFDVVAEIEQTAAASLRASAADGKIDPKEAAALKDQAVQTILAHLGDSIGQLQQDLGVGAIQLVDILSTKIESAVAARKLASKTGNG